MANLYLFPMSYAVASQSPFLCLIEKHYSKLKEYAPVEGKFNYLN